MIIVNYWTDVEQDRLRLLHRAHYTDAQIGERLGRTAASVRNMRNKLGLRHRAPAVKLSAEQRDKIIGDVEAGLMLKYAGAPFGLSKSAVSGIMFRHRQAQKDKAK